MSTPDRFVRFPTELLEALLRVQLSPTQWRILLWVIRQTYGWNRNATPFSWYRIAKDLSTDRGGTVRAGNKLLGAGLLRAQNRQLGIQKDQGQWEGRLFARRDDEADQLWLTGFNADIYDSQPMIGSIARDAGCHRARRQESSVFGRAIDSSKDKLKIHKDTHRNADDASRRHGAIENSERQLLAGAAKPVPGKYDGISEN